MQAPGGHGVEASGATRRLAVAAGVLLVGWAAAHGCAQGVESPADGDSSDDGSGGDGGGVGGSGGVAGGSTGGDGGATSSSVSSASSAASSSSGGVYCGNGTCDGSETCQTCFGDCGTCCGDGFCDGIIGEHCEVCPEDCGACVCGDGLCTGNETCQSCATDCCCGDGTCGPGECITCVVDCFQANCCGDANCNPFEDCKSCPGDCGPGCCPTPSPGDPTGPAIFVFADYDGGQFTIDVDSPQPNIVIGLVSYVGMQVTLTGASLANVTAVHYAGYDDPPATTVGGVAAALVTIDVLPPATLPDPEGNGNMVCNGAEGCGDQGGCNTSAQVKDYFVTKFGGTIASHSCISGPYMGTLTTSATATCN